MPATAAFAIAWIVARAAVQSVTIDEADTFLTWVNHSSPTHWMMAANNHVLNSMLMRVTVAIFGVSQFTIRLPALLGAVIYLTAAYGLSRIMARTLALRWAVFVCLVYNPFMMDYLVAARGYGLACGFLLSAIALAAWWHGANAGGQQPAHLTTICALCSISAALSVSANFAFAFVNAATMLLIFLWAWSADWGPAWRQRLGRGGVLLAACVLPGLLVGVVFAGPVLKHLGKFDFVYGAESLREMLRSILDSTTYELNRHFVNTVIYGKIQWLRRAMWPALGAAVLIRLLLSKRGWLADARARWLATLAAGAFAAGALALAGHWFIFRFFGVLLPKERTALFFVPLAFLLAGAVAAMPPVSRAASTARGAVVGVLLVMSGYFLLSLRLDRFKEWFWNSDVNRAYSVLADYNHKCGLREVTPVWRYTAALNFYRVASGRESFSQFVSGTAPAPGKPAYVLYYPEDEAFIKKEGLEIVHHSPETDLTIAIRPGTLPAGCR